MRPRRLTGIGPLFEQDRPLVQGHLLRLSRDDRAQRFGRPVSDEWIERFVATMDLDGSLGLFVDGELAGMAHLPDITPTEAELGISVEPRARSCGWGRALLSTSLESLHAVGTDTLTVHYTAQNRPMVALMRVPARTARQSNGDVTAQIALDGWTAERHAANALIETEA